MCVQEHRWARSDIPDSSKVLGFFSHPRCACWHPIPTASGSVLRSRSSSRSRAWVRGCSGRGRHVSPRRARVVARCPSRRVGSTCRSRPYSFTAARAKEPGNALLGWPKDIRGSAPCRRPEPSSFHMQQNPRNLLRLTPGCLLQTGRHFPFSPMKNSECTVWHKKSGLHSQACADLHIRQSCLFHGKARTSTFMRQDCCFPHTCIRPTLRSCRLWRHPGVKQANTRQGAPEPTEVPRRFLESISHSRIL